MSEAEADHEIGVPGQALWATWPTVSRSSACESFHDQLIEDGIVTFGMVRAMSLVTSRPYLLSICRNVIVKPAGDSERGVFEPRCERLTFTAGC